jgi:RimJ/RimL family protein N-acetyltransferase
MAIEAIDTGEHIGNVWFWAIDKTDRKAELRIVLGATGQAGRGAGTEAIRLMSDYAFGSLDLRRVYAYVLAFNERARKAFAKAGFDLEGVLKADRLTSEGPVDVYLLARVDGGARTP